MLRWLCAPSRGNVRAGFGFGRQVINRPKPVRSDGFRRVTQAVILDRRAGDEIRGAAFALGDALRRDPGLCCCNLMLWAVRNPTEIDGAQCRSHRSHCSAKVRSCHFHGLGPYGGGPQAHNVRQLGAPGRQDADATHRAGLPGTVPPSESWYSGSEQSHWGDRHQPLRPLRTSAVSFAPHLGAAIDDFGTKIALRTIDFCGVANSP